MKVIPVESLDMISISNKIKELEEELRIGYKINEVSINNIVFDYLKKLNLAKSVSKNKLLPRTDKFSVSQSSYDCYRKLYFEMLYPRSVVNDDSLGRFTMGDLIDNLMKDIFKSVGASVGSDCECGKDYFDGAFRIQGESDADFSDLIIEVKSVSPFAWVYIVGGKDRFGNTIVGKPKLSHERQLNSYLDIKGIENGVLVYINKDNFQVKLYPIKHDLMLMSQTVGRCATVYNAIIEKRVPDKVKGKECSFCNYKDMCRSYS